MSSSTKASGLSGDRKSATAAGVVSKTRSTGLITLALLLVLGSGLAVAAWTLAAGQKESLLAVAKPIPKGHVIEREDLVTLPVAGIAGGFTPEQVPAVVGKTTTVDLVNLQVITRDMVTSDPMPGPGKAMVGFSLEPNRVPADGLSAGDYVAVVQTGEGQEGKSVAKDALVWSVNRDDSATGRIRVTVVLDSDKAALSATASVADSIALVKIAPPGVLR